MSLRDFFRINLPYGIRKNSKNEWAAFNREYRPLGWNDTSAPFDIGNTDYPIYTKFKGLTENALLKIVTNPDRIHRNSEGKIDSVYFYNDRTNPQSNSKYWDDYFTQIKALSKFKKA